MFLPQNGVITNSAKSASFQLQPYDQPNVLVVDTDRTLTLSNPGNYSEISLLVNSRATRSGGILDFTLNYADGSSLELFSDAKVPNWTSGISPEGGSLAASLNTVLDQGAISLGDVQFDEYDFDLSSSPGLLQSIMFSNTGNKLDVFAVSGIVAAVPEPQIPPSVLRGSRRD